MSKRCATASGALERTPSDEATKAEIKELKSERAALRSLLSNLNGRDTFGFLTDEGLLPNYAFPEQGVHPELRDFPAHRWPGRYIRRRPDCL